jgi:hypothetical protein
MDRDTATRIPFGHLSDVAPGEPALAGFAGDRERGEPMIGRGRRDDGLQIRRGLGLLAGIVVLATACSKGSSSAATPTPAAATSVAAATGATGSSGATGASPSAGAALYSDNGVSFQYPASWETLNINSTSASTSAKPDWQTAVGPGPGSDFVTVNQYTVPQAVTSANIDSSAPTFTKQITSLFTSTGGSLSSGPTDLTVAGLPALEYEGDAKMTDGTDVATELVLAWDGTTEYFFNCQTTPAHSSEVDAGCAQVIATFAETG